MPHPSGAAHEMGDYRPGRPDPRHGNWMQTATGKMFWPLDPRPGEVHILDIAAALSKYCRFGGHCDFHYSVAQHSVYVSYQVPEAYALVGLLHDATEAYCGDMIRPIKMHMPEYKRVEESIWLAIASRWHLPVVMPKCVTDADNAVLLAEQAQIMRPAPERWSVPGSAANIRIAQWSPEQAREAFLSRFATLTGDAV